MLLTSEATLPWASHQEGQRLLTTRWGWAGTPIPTLKEGQDDTPAPRAIDGNDEIEYHERAGRADELLARFRLLLAPVRLPDCWRANCWAGWPLG